MISRVAALSAVVWLCACRESPRGTEAAPADASPPPRESALPTARSPGPSANGARRPRVVVDAGPFVAPKWTAGLPASRPRAQPGDRVLCAVPFRQGEYATVGLRELDSIDGDTATVVGLSRKAGLLTPNEDQVDAHVPLAVVFPVSDGASLGVKAGDVITAPVFGYGLHVVEVVGLEGKVTRFKVAVGESVIEETSEAVVPKVPGVAPLAWVAIPTKEGKKRGMVLAVAGDDAWAWAPGEAVARVPAKALRPLDIHLRPRAVGERILAFDRDDVMSEGKIARVVWPKWLYEVSIRGNTVLLPAENLVDP